MNFTKLQKTFFSFFLGAILLLGIALNDKFDLMPSQANDSQGQTGQTNGTVTGGLKLKVYFLNVGQGDAEYIRTPDGRDILIDGGPDKSVLTELGRVMPFDDKKIEMMILTHPHADHVDGLVEVLKRYEVEQIYYTGVLHTAPDYIAWLTEIKNKNVPMTIVKDYFEIPLGENLKLQFLAPQKDLTNVKVSDLNDSSIVNRLVFNKINFLFMGDLPAGGERALLDKQINVSAQILKTGHHGSKYSSDEIFLQKVHPEFGVIEVGKENSFGHPSLQTLERFSRQGIKALRTDELGTIGFVSDGITVEQLSN